MVKKKKVGRGRPVISIDFEEFEKLCAIQCTLEEIASWYMVSTDTIERRVQEHYGMNFAEIYAQKKGRGKVSIRRMMYQRAQEGDKTMLVWLSKQYLGMADKIEQKSNVTAEVVQMYEFQIPKNGSEAE